MKTNLYHEKLSSAKTEALFLVLMIVSLLLFILQVSTKELDTWAVVLLVFGAVFLFYSLNYRTLHIDIQAAEVRLTFGIFSRRVPLENIEAIGMDNLPAVLKYGGAGIHFMLNRDRYRVSFNFLEYPRVLIQQKRKTGLVQDVSFSTRRPEEVIHAVQEAMVGR